MAVASTPDREGPITSVPEIERVLGLYLSERWKRPVRVAGLGLVPGGAARATWRGSAISPDATRGIIVRIDSGTQLLPTDERLEFLTMAAVHRAGLPVPEPLAFETDTRWLGQPFSIVAEVPDCKTDPEAIAGEYRSRLGQQFWGVLGELARTPLEQFGADRFLPSTTLQTCASEQLAYWWQILRSNEIHPNPIAHAGQRWLARSLPPPALRLCLVHGDYRSGNFLFAPDGEIRAILDWEMAHIGDPYEDLAWSLDLRQNADRPGLAGGLLSNREAMEVWQRASGIQIDCRAFRWWQVFSAFKALAIWTLSARKFHEDSEKRPVLGRIGWLLVERQQRILLGYISPLAKRDDVEVMS